MAYTGASQRLTQQIGNLLSGQVTCSYIGDSGPRSGRQLGCPSDSARQLSFSDNKVRDRCWKFIHERTKHRKKDKAICRIANLTATTATDVPVIEVGSTLLEPEYPCLNYCYIKDATDICKSYYSESLAFSEDERLKIMSR